MTTPMQSPAAIADAKLRAEKRAQMTPQQRQQVMDAQYMAQGMTPEQGRQQELAIQSMLQPGATIGQTGPGTGTLQDPYRQTPYVKQPGTPPGLQPSIRPGMPQPDIPQPGMPQGPRQTYDPTDPFWQNATPTPQPRPQVGPPPPMPQPRPQVLPTPQPVGGIGSPGALANKPMGGLGALANKPMGGLGALAGKPAGIFGTGIFGTPAPVAKPMLGAPAPAAKPMLGTPAPAAKPMLGTPAPMANPTVNAPMANPTVTTQNSTMKKGGKVSSTSKVSKPFTASSRGDGIAQRGKTKGVMR